MKNIFIFITIIVISGGSYYIFQRYNDHNKPYHKPIIGQMRPEFAIEDLHGKRRSIREWNDKVILLNFWATWCPPCRRETPEFIQLQKKYGRQNFQIIGIAVDNEANVRKFAKKMKINYPIMAAQEEAVGLARRYGNRTDSLPYSVFIDRKGKISATFAGELSKNRAISILKQLGISDN